MIKVSIIIPMRNESRYIARCLDSLNNQTYSDFEVILIDDGSVDNTIEIANKYDVKLLKQQHWWPGRARNRWAKEAKWDIFVFVDADMYFDNKYLENLIKPILEWKEEWTAHATEKIWNPENVRARCWWLDRIPNPPARSGVYRAITKEAFEKSWWYNTDRFAFEDDIGGKWWISALNVKKSICYHNNPENLRETFRHDKWIWESMVAKWKLKEYVKKYYKILISFILFLWIFLYLFSMVNLDLIWLIVIIFFVIILFFEVWAIKKAIKENYRKYLWALPIVNLVRMFAYIYWMTKYLIFKK